MRKASDSRDIGTCSNDTSAIGKKREYEEV